MDSGQPVGVNQPQLAETLDVGRIPQLVWTNSEMNRQLFTPQPPVEHDGLAVISSK